MPPKTVSAPTASRVGRVPPYSEEAERGVLGSILLDASRVADLCVEAQLTGESFYVPAHRVVFETVLGMTGESVAIDVLTVTERLQSAGKLDAIGGAAFLDRLIDSTPTAAHAEYYIDIVRQKHLLRAHHRAARAKRRRDCYESRRHRGLHSRARRSRRSSTSPSGSTALSSLGRRRQANDGPHRDDPDDSQRGLSGRLHGVRQPGQEASRACAAGEMIVLAARPSMGKTSLAMNIAENVALGKGDPDGQAARGRHLQSRDVLRRTGHAHALLPRRGVFLQAGQWLRCLA